MWQVESHSILLKYGPMMKKMTIYDDGDWIYDDGEIIDPPHKRNGNNDNKKANRMGIEQNKKVYYLMETCFFTSIYTSKPERFEIPGYLVNFN